MQRAGESRKRPRPPAFPEAPALFDEKRQKTLKSRIRSLRRLLKQVRRRPL